jgi:hypothetical protein
MTYLLITEDQNVFKTDALAPGDLDAADDGLLDVIDISDPADPLRYFDGGWTNVEEAP